MEEPRWLTDDEQQAWRGLAAVLLKLPAALEHQLHRDAGIGHFDYFVLALLSEAPDRALRLSHLAEQSNASLSRLSHVVTRLQKRGWVERQPCPDDARATFAVLTDAGMDKVVETAPGHVARVRSLVFDGLGPEGVEDLRRVCDALLEGVEDA
jgi:DNA-binding MarR family transcriptional regulator